MERSHPGIVNFWGETGAVHLQDSEQVRDDTMVGVVRVSLARQPVLGADLQVARRLPRQAVDGRRARWASNENPLPGSRIRYTMSRAVRDLIPRLF